MTELNDTSNEYLFNNFHKNFIFKINLILLINII